MIWSIAILPTRQDRWMDSVGIAPQLPRTTPQIELARCPPYDHSFLFKSTKTDLK